MAGWPLGLPVNTEFGDDRSLVMDRRLACAMDSVEFCKELDMLAELGWKSLNPILGYLQKHKESLTLIKSNLPIFSFGTSGCKFLILNK